MSISGKWRTEQSVAFPIGSAKNNPISLEGSSGSEMVKQDNGGVDGNRTHDPLLAKQVL